MKHQIKHRYTETVLFECNLPDHTPIDAAVRLSLKKAIACNAILNGADLSETDLRDINLSGIDLRDVNLKGTILNGADLSETDLRDAYLNGADLRNAILIGADLRNADLRDANLNGANLNGADMRSAYLRNTHMRNAHLSNANLNGVKSDFWEILLRAPREITGLRAALVEGRVNGSAYKGECVCLIGTIANVRDGDVDYRDLGNGLHPNSSRPAECWFLGICKGDTPETNQISRITVEWIDEFVGLLTDVRRNVTLY